MGSSPPQCTHNVHTHTHTHISNSMWVCVLPDARARCRKQQCPRTRALVTSIICTRSHELIPSILSFHTFAKAIKKKREPKPSERRPRTKPAPLEPAFASWLARAYLFSDFRRSLKCSRIFSICSRSSELGEDEVFALAAVEPLVPVGPLEDADPPFRIASIASMWRIASVDCCRRLDADWVGRRRSRRRRARSRARRGGAGGRGGGRRFARRSVAGDAVAGELGEAAGAAAALLSGVRAAGVADAAGVDDAADAIGAAPPAAFSNSLRCARNSSSLARIAGSMPVVPEVPTAPGVPVAGAVGAAGLPRPSRQPARSGLPEACRRTRAIRSSW